jgi:hypothetical protein
MKTKLKRCNNCLQLQPIWKRHNKLAYCKSCWFATGLAKVKLKKVSKKQQRLNTEYSVLRLEFLAKPENQHCHAQLETCLHTTGIELTIHHSKGRGKYLLDVSTWVPLCLMCHRWVEEHPDDARLLNFTKTRV